MWPPRRMTSRMGVPVAADRCEPGVPEVVEREIGRPAALRAFCHAR